MAKSRSALLYFFTSLILGLSCAPLGMPNSNAVSTSTYSAPNTPDRDTPPKIREVWLRFHKDDLCEEVDAGFLFHKGEMEVLVNLGNEAGNRKFFKMLEPLQNSYPIKLHTIKIHTEQELIDIKNIPPSFWLNSKLTGFLRDSFLRDTNIISVRQQTDPTGWTPSIMFGQRMLMFARDTLDYNRKVRLHASHLPALARAAFDPQITPDLRHQALEVCRAHAKKLEKYTKKLNGNITMALPEAPDKSNKTARSDDPIMDPSPIDTATRLANEAEDLSRLVYRFIYPQSHTVALSDLLDPTLLQSLNALRETTMEFRNSIE